MFVTTAISGERQERAIGLVGLDDQPLAVAPAGVGAQVAHLAADDPAGVQPARRAARAAIIAVVVVLPCAPATAITRARRGDLAAAARRAAGPAARARAPRRAPGCRARSRSSARPRRRRPAGRCRRDGRRSCGSPSARAAARSTGDHARSEPVTCAPERVRGQRVARSCPRPPIPTRCSASAQCRTASDRSSASRRTPPAHADAGGSPAIVASRAVADRARAARGSERAAPIGPRSAAGASPSSAADLAREPLGRQLARPGSRPPRRRRAIQRALAVWWSPAACGYGIRIAGRPCAAISKIEPPARATQRSARRQRVAERRDVLAQVVVSAGGDAVAQRRRSRARPQACSTWNGAPANAVDRGLVDRARAERPAEDQHARVVLVQAEALARGRARSVTGGGTGRPVTQVARRRRGPSIGNARHTRRANAREQPVGQAEVAVGLGQHERDPRAAPRRPRPARRRSRRRPSRRRAARSRSIRRAATNAPTAFSARARRLERVAAADPLDAQRAQLVAGRGDQLAPRRARRRRRRPRGRQPAARRRPPARAPRAPPSRRLRSATFTIAGSFHDLAAGSRVRRRRCSAAGRPPPAARRGSSSRRR